MSKVIKLGEDRSSVRPLSTLRALTNSAIPDDKEPLRRRIAVLESEIGQREETISGLRLEVERSFNRGLEQGRAEGRSEAEDKQAQRLACLATNLQQARALLADRLASLERLAPLLAQECLEKILGAGSDRRALLETIIAKQVAAIERSMVLGVEVSRSDFPEQEALVAMAEKHGLSSSQMVATGTQKSGDCVITLRLGRLEIGINQQWGHASRLLAELGAAP